MRLSRFVSPSLLAVTFWLVPAAPAAHAAAIYDFFGAPFDQFHGTLDPAVTQITASVTFASPLAADLSFQSEAGAVAAWSISDGFSTIDQNTTGAQIDSLVFATGDDGEILNWYVQFEVSPGNPNPVTMRTFYRPDFARQEATVYSDAVAAGDSAGTWTLTNTDTPEPAYGPLASLLLLALVLAGKRCTKSSQFGV